MRIGRVVIAVVAMLACLAPCVWPEDGLQVAQLGQAPRVTPGIRPLRILRPRFPLLSLPDLTVQVTGPYEAVAGTDINLTVTVRNEGTAVALGTNTAAPGHNYFIDLVLSSNSIIPVRVAVWPGYAGKTRDDFVEDMLLQGGRDTIPGDIAPNAQRTYSHPVYIPRNTPPGLYWIGAVVDPSRAVWELREFNNTFCYPVMIAPPSAPGVDTGPGVWVMPYAVGGTPLYRIKPTGLTDYTDGSGLSMVNAPFGAYLGLRHGYHSSLPTPALTHYRWLYQRVGETEWHEFNQPVGVHYERDEGGHVTFPVYMLGPKGVAGKLLYEFRPHNPPAEAGAVTKWPTSDWFGDIYSGFLNSPELIDGTYRIKLELFNATGNQVMPGASTFRFIVPTGVAANGDTLTRNALGPEINGGGYVFALQVDNHLCSAVIDNPQIGDMNVADPWGFLHYTNRATDQISINYHATHPRNYAVLGFSIVRASTTVDSANGEVFATALGSYEGDGNGNFGHDFLINQLIPPECPGWAAFAEVLHVYAKATTGWGNRIASYDAGAVRAFAIAPEAAGMAQVLPTPSAPPFTPVPPEKFQGPVPPEFDALGIPIPVPVAPEHLKLMAVPSGVTTPTVRPPAALTVPRNM
ncbi:hypothetical protein LLH03_19135 [bacterium]|nr:hypothetical protein [bacterium]